LVVAAACAALAAGVPARGAPATSAVECHVPGEWPRGRDAAWLWKRLRAAGFRDIGCTGSAFDVDYGGSTLLGRDFYIWAFTARGPRHESPRVRVIAGVRVHVDRVQLSWSAGRRMVWLSAGSTSRDLPPLTVLRRVIRATTRC
jgi:hypothetical protein